jgi:hypothetical protein
MDERVTVRLARSQVIKLDALAGAAGVSRSTVFRRLLDGAEEAAIPAEREPLEADELRALATEQANNGNMNAVRYLRDEQREAEAQAEIKQMWEIARGEPA